MKSKIETRGGKKNNTVVGAKQHDVTNPVEPTTNRESSKKAPATSRAPVLRPRMKNKNMEAKTQAGPPMKKKKEWVPPGIGKFAPAAGNTSWRAVS